MAQGSPGKIASTQADPAGGIQLLVQGTKIGDRGTVTLARGVMNQLEAYLSEFVGLSGTLTNKVAASTSRWKTWMRRLPTLLPAWICSKSACVSSLPRPTR